MPEPLPAIDEPTVIFVINRLWSPDSDDESVYAVTRGDWKVGASTRERARIALGIAGNVVRGAYRIDGWQPGGESGRWRFNGTPAPELDAVGKTVVHLAPRAGAANPIRRFLDGVPLSTPPVGAASEHMPERITPAPPSANPSVNPEPRERGPISLLAHELNREPLARIMYGQRELFHSNFLAWFFDEIPDLADAVFRDLTVDGNASVRRVDREQENLDLVMRWPGAAPLVIENKVFSLPEQDQLDAYRAKTARWKGSPAEHVLLSMSPPRMPLPDWRYLNYQELADRIDTALPENDHSYEVETLRHYSRVIRLLESLLATTMVRSFAESAWVDERQLSEIDSSQTRIGLRKLRARRVQGALDAAGPTSGWTESAISHGQPLVGWRRELRVAGHVIQAGWQYQEGQFRLCAVLPHLNGRGESAKVARAVFSEAHPALFDFAPLDGILSTPDGVVRPLDRFGHFDPDFIYRYIKATDQTVEQLIAASHTVHAGLDRIAE